MTTQPRVSTFLTPPWFESGQFDTDSGVDGDSLLILAPSTLSFSLCGCLCLSLRLLLHASFYNVRFNTYFVCIFTFQKKVGWGTSVLLRILFYFRPSGIDHIWGARERTHLIKWSFHLTIINLKSSRNVRTTPVCF